MAWLGLAWKFRKLIGVVLAVLAIVGALAWAVHWHGEQIDEVFAAGEAEKQAEFDAAAADAEIREIKRQRRESEAVAAGVRQRAAQRFADAAARKERTDDLQAQAAADPNGCRPPTDAQRRRMYDAWGLDAGG